MNNKIKVWVPGTKNITIRKMKMFCVRKHVFIVIKNGADIV